MRKIFDKIIENCDLLNENNPNKIAQTLINSINEAKKKSTKKIKIKLNNGSKLCAWCNFKIVNAIKKKTDY